MPVKFTSLATGCMPGVTTLTRGMEVLAARVAGLGADARLIQTAAPIATATAIPAAPNSHLRRDRFLSRIEHQHVGFRIFLQLSAHESS